MSLDARRCLNSFYLLRLLCICERFAACSSAHVCVEEEVKKADGAPGFRRSSESQQGDGMNTEGRDAKQDKQSTHCGAHTALKMSVLITALC